jgi:hypothetical protein
MPELPGWRQFENGGGLSVRKQSRSGQSIRGYRERAEHGGHVENASGRPVDELLTSGGSRKPDGLDFSEIIGQRPSIGRGARVRPARRNGNDLFPSGTETGQRVRSAQHPEYSPIWACRL